MAQQRYWTELNHLKTQTNYVEGLCANVGEWDKRVRIVTAIASSVSIGSWLIWKEYSFVWAGIVAASQVLNAISPVLAFNESKKTYSALAHDLETLFNQAEAKWYDICVGKIDVDKLTVSARLSVRREQRW